MRRSYLFVILIIIFILVAITFFRNFGYFDIFSPTPTPSTPTASPNLTNITRSIKEGTQLHLTDDIDIALGSIRDNSAWLVIHKKGMGVVNKTVAVGDKFEIYGFMIEVKSMKENTNFSLALGSSNGGVTLLISKK